MYSLRRFYRAPKQARRNLLGRASAAQHRAAADPRGPAESTAIVLLDADGIVRWHSEGVQVPPADDPLARRQIDDQWTIIQAVEFAQQL